MISHLSVVFAEAVTEHGVLTSKDLIVMQWNISWLFIKTILDKELGKTKKLIQALSRDLRCTIG